MIEELSNRLKKRFTHLKKWAKREGVTCFRLYEKDLPDYPLIVDWMDGDVVVWVFDRTRDDTDEKKEVFYHTIEQTVMKTFDLEKKNIYIKKREKRRGVETQYNKISNTENTKVVTEYGVKFELNLTDYLDVGLFLDHRKTRKIVRGMAKGKRVLNLFSYTGSFTCFAIDGGAVSTTTVDLNQRYIEWSKRNVKLNRFRERRADRFLVENNFPFIKNEAAHNRYDVIICDPPTFSNSKKMKKPFAVDSDHIELIRDCVKLLDKNGVLIFSTNSRTFKLDSSLEEKYEVNEWTQKTISEDFKGKRGHRVWFIGKR